MFAHSVKLAPMAMTLLLVSATARGQASEPAATTYVLADGSTYQRGCFPPCDCPIMQEVPLRGTFNLRHASSDPDWFETYEVTDVQWVAMQNDQDVSISGSGTYRIGGNFALQHRLALDLAVGQDPVEHYDSGTVVGGSEFPAIVTEISIHGQNCFDTLMVIRAKPTLSVAVDDSQITWDVIPTATGYDLVLGDLATLRDTAGEFQAATAGCVVDDAATPAVPFDEMPLAGAGFWFDVRALGEQITATYDSGYPAQLRSRDPGINASPLSCP